MLSETDIAFGFHRPTKRAAPDDKGRRCLKHAQATPAAYGGEYVRSRSHCSTIALAFPLHAPGVKQPYTGEQPMRASIARFVLSALLLALSLPAAAQPPGKVYRIGILAGSAQE